MTGRILFTIIIANFNKGDNIHSLLASIYDHPPCDDFELFFMDDASIDASVVVAEQFPVRVFRRGDRVGPATLRNIAAGEARGEYLLFVDSDTILPPGSLQRFRELCLAGGFDAVSGLEVLPPVIDNWIGWFKTLQVRDIFLEYHHKEGDIEAWGATLGGVRRQLFLDIGGFNEVFRGADVEDHELAVKMNRQGRLIFSPRMTYRHSYPCALDAVRKQFRRAAQMMQLEEGGRVGHSLLFRWRYKAGHLLSVVIVVGAAAAACNHTLVPLLLAALLAKLIVNKYLFIQAFRVKGPFFMVYAFCMSLVMGASIVAGALYGKIRQALP
jgi:glycosyltransferase involved in cell wall biosynthesis